MFLILPAILKFFIDRILLSSFFIIDHNFSISFSGFYETITSSKMRTTPVILILLSLGLASINCGKPSKKDLKNIAEYKKEHQKWLDLYKYKPEKNMEQPTQQNAATQPQAQPNVAPSVQQAEQKPNQFVPKKKPAPKKKQPQ